MLFRYLGFFCAFFLLPGVIVAADVAAPHSAPSISDKLDAVLQNASRMPESPFHLQVNCTDRKGIRSLNLYSGGTTIWNRRSQIMLPPSARSTLLKTLIEQGFSKFKDSYGGREHPEKSAAPARVSCRILIEIENLQKSSEQRAGGEQLEQLLSLAAELLDQVERFADSGVTPRDLQDAMDKLSDGQLGAQTLRLRFIDLPARKTSNPGSILRIAGGNMSTQAYSPGQANSVQALEPLEHGQYMKLIAALKTAQLASLPGNLWSEDQVELEVQVLAHKKVVLARRFTRLDPTAQEAAQKRFNTLLLVLRKLSD